MGFFATWGNHRAASPEHIDGGGATPPYGAASKDERKPTWQDAGTLADIRDRAYLRRSRLHDTAVDLQSGFNLLAARRPQLSQLSRQKADAQQGLTSTALTPLSFVA
jgi:hypothetical protein